MTAKMTIIEGNSNDKDNVRAYMVKGEQGSTEWGDLQGNINNQTDLINKIDTMIENELANFEHLDYKVADSVPTPTEVIIGGQTYPTETGVRYLVKHATDDKYEEYILIDGVIYNIGSTEDFNLDDYYTKTETDDIIDPIDIVSTPTTEIPENADLNTYTTRGTWRCNSGARAQTLLNCPTISPFKLIVVYVHDDTRPKQFCLVGGIDHATIYTRTYTSAGWGNWQEITYNGYIYKGLLTTNTDLNNITDPGVYFTGNITLRNAPTDYSWKSLLVLKLGEGQGAVVQQVLLSSTHVYIRVFSGNPKSWHPWREYTPESRTIIFSNNSGSDGDITLSEDIDNFDYIEILGQEIGGRNIYSKMHKKTTFIGEKITLDSVFGASNSVYIRTATYVISNTKLTQEFKGQVTIENSAYPIINTSTSPIKIIKVIGYRYLLQD